MKKTLQTLAVAATVAGTTVPAQAGDGQFRHTQVLKQAGFKGVRVQQAVVFDLPCQFEQTGFNAKVEDSIQPKARRACRMPIVEPVTNEA